MLLATDKCDYKCESSEQCFPADDICNTVRNCPRGDDEQLHCGKWAHTFSTN